MTNCQKCGKEIKENAVRCIHCGSYQEDDIKKTILDKKNDSTPRQKTITIFLFAILTLLGAAIIIFFVITGISAMLSGGSDLSNTQSISATPTFSTFNNQTLGFKINYPVLWNYEIASDLSGIKLFDPNGISETEILMIDLSSDYRHYSVDELTKKLTESWQDPKSEENIQILTNNEAILSGLYARELVYAYSGNSGDTYKGVIKITKKGNRLYLLTFTTNENYFDSFSSTIQAMFDSFVIESENQNFECLVNVEGSGSDVKWNLDWNPAYTWSDGSETYYQDGVLFILDNPTTGSTFHTFNREFDNFVVEVYTSTVSGTVNNWQGIEIRQKDKFNFYTFDISSDGYYEIVKFVNGVPTTLIKPTFSDDINQGIKTTNHIKVIANGSNFTFLINGNVMAAINDDTFSSGVISLRALAPSSGDQSTEVAFYNFEICQPE